MPVVKISCLSLLLAVALYAQEPSQPAADATPPLSNPTPTTSDSSSNSALDYLFNRKPQEGTVAKDVMNANRGIQARAIARDALGGGRIEDPNMRARFEKYLGIPEVPSEELQAYNDEISALLKLLKEKKTTDAWRELFKLAEYESIDAGVSWELANRVESIWNADKTNYQLGRANEKLRRDIDTANRTADMMSDDIRGKELEYQRRSRQITRANSSSKSTAASSNTEGGGGDAPPPSVDTVMGKLQLTEEYLHSLELKAKIKMNELKAEKLFDKAKNDFAEYITTLYYSGRQRHVLIAADFWRNIFDQGEYPVSMAQQVNASLEMSREVQNSIKTFDFYLAKNDLATATDRLQEAFMLNELHPAVLGLARDKKQRIEEFTRRLSRMQNMLEARDFANLETVLEEMKKIAPDFDVTKPMAIVDAVKLESQLRLGKAKMAAQQGELKQAMEEFQAAAEAWPKNPDLKDKALTFFNSQDLQTQSLTEFDRLVADNNYRGIFDKQLMFAPAMKDDAKRQEQLKAALEKVKIAEMAIEKANLLRANGDVFGAWEAVELAVKDLPTDIKLNTLRGELAGRGAEFVAAINKAKEAELRKDLGYSLTWYAIAQRYYPASQMANQAIQRLAREIAYPESTPSAAAAEVKNAPQ
jgi:tetratricopeptide (TPR) repeat protein